MSVDLLGYAKYVPYNWLAGSTVQAARGGQGASSAQRAVAGADEDAVTMAVAAVRGLEVDSADADRLILASSHAPFLDKSNSAVVHAAARMRPDALTIDLAGIRSGHASLICANDRPAVAVLSDLCAGSPGSTQEIESGDAAAAFAFGDGQGRARLEASLSWTVELMDSWRATNAAHSEIWEERFTAHVYTKTLSEKLLPLLVQGDVSRPDHIVVSGRSARLARQVSALISPDADTKIQDNHRAEVGYCGAADVGVLLCDAFDQARAGEVVVAVSLASGIDVTVWRVLRDGPGRTVGDKAPESLPYVRFLTWKGELATEGLRRPDRPPVAAPPAMRNLEWKYGLTGTRCRQCSKVYLPGQRVCGECKSVDSMEPYNAADRVGRIAGISTDSLSGGAATPSVVGVVDFDEGGRLKCEFTEVEGSDLSVGDHVEMTFRRMYSAHGVPNYFWKAKPRRNSP